MFTMRIPVVDRRGIPLMPCTAPKARALLKSGKAHPKRNKLGLFYLQLTYEQEPANQRLVVGIDPGSRFEGVSVVGTKETVCNLMVEAPTHVKEAVKARRTLRRARRHRFDIGCGGVPVAPRTGLPSFIVCHPPPGAGGRPKPASCGSSRLSCPSPMRR